MGRSQPTTHLTVGGVVLMITQMGTKLSGRREAAGFVARILPDTVLARDVVLHHPIVQAEVTATTLRRRTRMMEAREGRRAETVVVLDAEVERLQDADERAGAADLLREEVRQMSERARLTRRADRLERDVADEQAERALVEADLEAERNATENWKAMALDMVRKSKRRGPTVRDEPEGGVN